MRSPTFIYFVSVVLAALCFATGAYAQSSDTITGNLPTINVVPQVNCPIRLTVTINQAMMGPQNFRLTVDNVGNKPIRAFVTVVDGKASKYIQSEVLTGKPFEVSETMNRGFATQEFIDFSIDYVEFSDSSTWGADKYGWSKQIARLNDGHAAVLESLKKLTAAYPDRQDIIDQASGGGFHASGPLGPPSEEKLKGQFQFAFKGALDFLRAFPKRSKEAQELADKLEAEIPK